VSLNSEESKGFTVLFLIRKGERRALRSRKKGSFPIFLKRDSAAMLWGERRGEGPSLFLSRLEKMGDGFRIEEKKESFPEAIPWGTSPAKKKKKQSCERGGKHFAWLDTGQQGKGRSSKRVQSVVVDVLGEKGEKKAYQTGGKKR